MTDSVATSHSTCVTVQSISRSSPSLFLADIALFHPVSSTTPNGSMTSTTTTEISETSPISTKTIEPEKKEYYSVQSQTPTTLVVNARRF